MLEVSAIQEMRGREIYLFGFTGEKQGWWSQKRVTPAHQSPTPLAGGPVQGKSTLHESRPLPTYRGYRVAVEMWAVESELLPDSSLGHYSCFQSLSRVPLFVTPLTAARQSSPTLTNSLIY